LLNRIARREAAIVSPLPGTTRDVIEVHLDLDGYPVTLLDTAGIRESDDPIEQEGVRRARARAAEADLVVWVRDAVDGSPKPTSLRSASTWEALNKIDLLNKSESKELQYSSLNNVFRLSCVTGVGIEPLIEALGRYASTFFGAEPSLVSRERHRKLLEVAVSALDRALVEARGGREDIIAEELRSAAASLGKLTGRVDVEDILDVIFRDFCIGK
jgi:tRNA modification GTPase